MKHNEQEKVSMPFKNLPDFLTEKRNRLLLIGIAGVLLIFMSDFIFPEKESNENIPVINPVTETGNREILMEEKLTELLQSVEGAGKVCVMITLENGGETVYACDRRTDQQTECQNGENTISRKKTDENEHIIMDTPAGKRPLVKAYHEPEIRGVAVVCEGGNNITVVKRITEIVSIVLKLPSNRICVAKMI